MADPIRILSVDGGGIRGLIPAIVLAHLEDRAGRPICELFDVLAGTSKGGIQILTLTRPRAGQREPAWRARDVVDLYDTWGPRIFSRTLWRKIRTVNSLLDEKYGSEAFDEMLLRYLGETKLSEALNEVLVTAYDTHERSTFFFKSALARQRDDDDFPMRVAARATAAAPTYFEPVRLVTGGRTRSLVDGGLFANNPAMCAYAEVRRYHPDADVLLVSLGTGELTAPLPYPRVRGWGLAEWARPILDVVFDGIADATDYQLTQLLGEGYWRFQVELDQRNQSIDDASGASLDALREKAGELISARGPDLEALLPRLARD